MGGKEGSDQQTSTAAQELRTGRRKLYIKENPGMGEETAGAVFDFKESARDLSRITEKTKPELGGENLQDAGTQGGSQDNSSVKPNLAEGVEIN